MPGGADAFTTRENPVSRTVTFNSAACSKHMCYFPDEFPQKACFVFSAAPHLANLPRDSGKKWNLMLLPNCGLKLPSNNPGLGSENKPSGNLTRHLYRGSAVFYRESAVYVCVCVCV